jgi:hypothetical protein
MPSMPPHHKDGRPISGKLPPCLSNSKGGGAQRGEMPDLHLAVIVLHLNRGTNFVCGDRILAPQIHSSAQHNASSAISINDFAWMPSYRFGRDDGASMKTTDPVVSNGST